MKKLLAFILISLSVSAIAVNYQMWFQGTWESQTKYARKSIGGSSSQTAPVTVDPAGTFILAGESRAVVGVKPESQPTAWTKI